MCCDGVGLWSMGLLGSMTGSDSGSDWTLLSLSLEVMTNSRIPSTDMEEQMRAQMQHQPRVGPKEGV